MLNKDNNDYISINLGVGGWGTLQETKYLKDHFDAFKPDVVVLTYCANDPGDDESFKAGLKDDDQGIFKIPGKVFLRDHSHLYRFLFYRFGRIVQNIAFYLRSAGRQGQGGDSI